MRLPFLVAPLSVLALSRRAVLVAPVAASLAPPRIERVVDYDELVALARGGQVTRVQIAPQHDHVVATLREGGARVACPLSDRAFPHLLADTMDASGLPYEVVPLDATRAAVRDVAKGAAAAAAAFVGLEAAGAPLGLRERFTRLRGAPPPDAPPPPPPPPPSDDDDA